MLDTMIRNGEKANLIADSLTGKADKPVARLPVREYEFP